ncbi:MAG: hypothetical protein SGPRY_003116 [Prymnesium sp.]
MLSALPIFAALNLAPTPLSPFTPLHARILLSAEHARCSAAMRSPNPLMAISIGANVQYNPYDVLGVTPESSMHQLKAAFRACAKQYHPDLNQGKDASLKFGQIRQLIEAEASFGSAIEAVASFVSTITPSNFWLHAHGSPGDLGSTEDRVHISRQPSRTSGSDGWSADKWMASQSVETRAKWRATRTSHESMSDGWNAAKRVESKSAATRAAWDEARAPRDSVCALENAAKRMKSQSTASDADVAEKSHSRQSASEGWNAAEWMMHQSASSRAKWKARRPVEEQPIVFRPQPTILASARDVWDVGLRLPHSMHNTVVLMLHAGAALRMLRLLLAPALSVLISLMLDERR